MAKRRSVMLGLGALATGSGAVFASGAFEGNVVDPEADFRILSDALRIEAGSESDDNIDYVDLEGDDEFTEFGNSPFDREGLPHAEVAENRINDELALQVGQETRSSYTFGEILHVTNDTSTTYDVGFNYAADVSEEGNDYGYGADAGNEGNADNILFENVNDIFQFEDNGDGDTSGGTLISADPGASGNDRGLAANTVSLDPGETMKVDLTVDTTDYTGNINSVAASGDNTGPWAEAANFVDLLDTVFVEAEEST